MRGGSTRSLCPGVAATWCLLYIPTQASSVWSCFQSEPRQRQSTAYLDNDDLKAVPHPTVYVSTRVPHSPSFVPTACGT
eukprot:701203-Rhodomonas_salina.1